MSRSHRESALLSELESLREKACRLEQQRDQAREVLNDVGRFGRQALVWSGIPDGLPDLVAQIRKVYSYKAVAVETSCWVEPARTNCRATTATMCWSAAPTRKMICRAAMAATC